MNPFEPERYELHTGPAYTFDLNRREMFKLLGGGIVILSIISDASAQESGGGWPRGGSAPRAPQEIGAWLHIGDNGAITAYTGKTEVGQNIRTSLTQVVCEELRVPMSSVRLVMADTDLTPYDGGTTGSRTTPDMAARLRKVSAAARELLIDLAAKNWHTDRGALVAANGRVSRADHSIEYSQLTKGQKLMKTIEDAPTTPAEAWQVCGKPAPKVDGRAMVTGRHKYASDVKLPRCCTAKCCGRRSSAPRCNRWTSAKPKRSRAWRSFTMETSWVWPLPANRLPRARWRPSTQTGTRPARYPRFRCSNI